MTIVVSLKVTDGLVLAEATHGVGRYWGIADITGFLFLAVDELTLSYRHEANADIPKPA
jgi:hypothetical protein